MLEDVQDLCSTFSCGVAISRAFRPAACDHRTVEVVLTSGGVPQVHVLIDRDSDGHAEETRLLIGGLDHPNGVTWLDGALYVMTDTLLLRYANIDTYALSGEVRTPDWDLHGVSRN